MCESKGAYVSVYKCEYVIENVCLRLRECDRDISFIIILLLLQDAWLVCFDEIQVADYASCTLLDRLFSHMLDKGAVIVGTSNRAPKELGDVSITDDYDSDTESVQETIASFSSVFTKNCHLHNISSDRDHRTEMKPGELRYLYPCSIENEKTLDIMFTKLIPPKTNITSSTVEVYGRKVSIPLSAGHIARFSFRELCSQPLGSADYIKICNSFQTIFIDNIPKLNMNTRNEARRFLTFIDAAYESRVQLYCSADTSCNELFHMLPREDGNYEAEQMHVEMIGEIAYDLKLYGMDFRSLNIISGEDEIFSFQRAISRLKEIQSAYYQSTEYHPQEFLPYVGSREETENAQNRRKLREKRRQDKLNEINKETEMENNKTDVINDKNINDRLYNETDWGDEASYLTYSKEMSTLSEKNSKRTSGRKDLPKFGDQHFWGFDWWEQLRKKWKRN